MPSRLIWFLIITEMKHFLIFEQTCSWSILQLHLHFPRRWRRRERLQGSCPPGSSAKRLSGKPCNLGKYLNQRKGTLTCAHSKTRIPDSSGNQTFVSSFWMVYLMICVRFLIGIDIQSTILQALSLNTKCSLPLWIIFLWC